MMCIEKKSERQETIHLDVVKLTRVVALSADSSEEFLSWNNPSGFEQLKAGVRSFIR